MLKGFHLQKTPGRGATVMTGAASRLLNGAFGMGGPPVVLFYFSTSSGAASGRASVIAFFFLTYALGLIALSRHGLVTSQSVVQFAVWLPALLIGVAIGTRWFKGFDADRFRRLVLMLLIALAVLTLAEASYSVAARGSFR